VRLVRISQRSSLDAPLPKCFRVLAGLATIIARSNGIDTVLESTGIFPSLDEQRSHGFNTPWILLLALGYRVVFAFVGGRLTAVLSPSSPNKHVGALVTLGFVLGLAGTVACSNRGSATLLVLGDAAVSAEELAHAS
jgi:hypothetical protein